MSLHPTKGELNHWPPEGDTYPFSAAMEVSLSLFEGTPKGNQKAHRNLTFGGSDSLRKGWAQVDRGGLNSKELKESQRTRLCAFFFPKPILLVEGAENHGKTTASALGSGLRGWSVDDQRLRAQPSCRSCRDPLFQVFESW